MKNTLKRAGLILGTLAGLFLLAVIILSIIGSNKLNKQYNIQPESVAVGSDTAVLQRGQYLYSISCAGCHGDNLAGTPFFDDPGLGSIPASNLTTGTGGIGAVYSETDLVRAIRHGIDNEGKPLMIMPAGAFWYYSDEDLAAIIAYLKNAVPIDNDLGEKNLKLMGRILVGAGLLDVLAAEHIDHAASRPAAPPPQVDAAYGQYLVNVSDCRSCHGAALSGGQSSEPGAPPGPDLTPGGNLADWPTVDFITAMRTGTTLDGRQLSPEFMPWEDYGRMTDDDLTTIFLYLQSLPANGK
ncbi:MAG: c-type cytochrome [Ardenticatenaceae bacterium]|nr:c-type cytochrome [Ardenticatenaceae bacterium]MCB9445708.1 c-type cytochrome [Ardenticatenaceae bacterium]